MHSLDLKDIIMAALNTACLNHDAVVANMAKQLFPTKGSTPQTNEAVKRMISLLDGQNINDVALYDAYKTGYCLHG